MEEYPELMDKLVCVCNVFARMSPEQKQQLVNKLQEVEYTVAMCGDGANDCAALKVAFFGGKFELYMLKHANFERYSRNMQTLNYGRRCAQIQR